MDESYRYCEKLNKVNFREIASFQIFLCCLKTNAKAKKVITLEWVDSYRL